MLPDLDVNRQKRSQALVQFRASAKPVVDDWKAIVEVVSLTESASTAIRKIEGMNAFKRNLDYQIQGWNEMRNDLSVAIAMSEGREDGMAPDPKTQAPTTTIISGRLSAGIQDPFNRLRIAWEQIVAGSCE